MPPTKRDPKKKRKKAVQIQVHNVDQMNRRELTYYISRLEDQLKQAQRNCGLYNVKKDRFVSLLEQEQEKYLRSKRLKATTDCERQDVIENLKVSLRKCGQDVEYKDQRNREKRILEAFNEYLITISNVSKDNSLKSIQGKERILADDSLLSEIITRDMIACNLFDNYKNQREENLMELISKCRNTVQNFSIIKQRLLNSIWSFDKPTENLFANDMSRMHDYFRSLQHDNAKALQIWREKIIRLQCEQERINSELRKVSDQNSELRRQQKSSPHLEYSTSTYETPRCNSMKKIVEDMDIEKLVVLNWELVSKLKKAEVEKEKLEKDVLSLVRNLYQTSAYKAFVTEEILRIESAFQDLSSSGESEQDYILIPHDKSRYQENDKELNMLKINFQASDTLFVPPLYLKGY